MSLLGYVLTRTCPQVRFLRQSSLLIGHSKLGTLGCSSVPLNIELQRAKFYFGGGIMQQESIINTMTKHAAHQG
jgi:hypothetical protein